MSNKPLTSDELTQLTSGLRKLARNLWWTWSQEAQELFQQLSPRGWQNLYHNAVAVLHEVSDYELRVRLQDDSEPFALLLVAAGSGRTELVDVTPAHASSP